MTNKEIGKRMKKARRKFGITQIELAKFCGLTQATISSWERGERSPSITNALIVCEFLGISLKEYVGV